MTRMSKQGAARIGGILAGAGVLFAGGVLVASSPALADNGPHIMMTNTNTAATQSGIGGSLGGGCASCHRVHSAKASVDLLKTSDEVALCESCHGPTGNGSSTDVMDGVAFTADANATHSATGALRGGGFQNAAIDSTNATRGYGVWNAGSSSWRVDKTVNEIKPLANPAATTSNHGVGVPDQTIWGNGAFSASVNYGKTGVTLECTSCHNPHGNGNFRILQPVPSTTTTVNGVAVPADPASVLPTVQGASWSASVATYTLATAYPLAVGQTVSVTGNTNAAFNVVKATITAVGLADTKTFAVPSFAVAIVSDPGTFGTGVTTVTPVFPDVVDTGTQVYTTTNYWKEDPFATPTSVQSPLNSAGKSSFIANVSQWCSTCHTRYLSTSGGTSRTVDTGDALFGYRHTSASGKQDSPNCIQCHVAHGTNASMSGTSGSTEANSPQYLADANGNLGLPASVILTGGDHGSKLLRVANRGVCQMCHNK